MKKIQVILFSVLVIVLVTLIVASPVLAATSKKTTKTSVQKDNSLIQTSTNNGSVNYEKIVDKETGIICYTALTSNGTPVGISCLKM